MRWLNSITDSMDVNLSKLREILEDRGAWDATVHEVTEQDTIAVNGNNRREGMDKEQRTGEKTWVNENNAGADDVSQSTGYLLEQTQKEKRQHHFCYCSKVRGYITF